MQCSSKCNIKSLHSPVLSPCPASAYIKWRESDLRVEVLMSVEGVGLGEGVCDNGGNWMGCQSVGSWMGGWRCWTGGCQ